MTTESGADPLNSSIDVVLFDMGGVVVELGPLPELLGLDTESGSEWSPEQFWSRWLASPTVRGLENGSLAPERFAEDLVAEFGLDLEPDDLLVRFTAFPRGLFPGARELVEDVRRRVVTGVLSNTNHIHWEGQPDAAVVQSMFDRSFLSYRIGLLKPDADFYRHVLAELSDVTDDPARVLFLDDNQVNVDGAAAVGITAHRARGPAEAAPILARYGLAPLSSG